MDKNEESNSNHIIYPYMNGLSGISYNDKDAESGYFIPANIALGHPDEPELQAVMTTGDINGPLNIDTLYGMWGTATSGNVKLRAYLRMSEGITPEQAQLIREGLVRQ